MGSPIGARGKLKLASHLTPVAEALAGSAAAEVPAAAPKKPSALEADSGLSELWDELVPDLARTGLIAPSDGPALELALRHFLMARRAAEQVGETVTVTDHGHGGVKKAPAEAVFRAESSMFLRYAQQLGLTFVARARTEMASRGGGASGDPNPFTPEAAGS